MAVKKMKFTSNIKCAGCIAKVTPYFNAATDIRAWHVEVEHPQKVLTVESENLSADDVRSLVAKAGFKAEPMA
jgi:copper chaperone